MMKTPLKMIIIQPLIATLFCSFLFANDTSPLEIVKNRNLTIESILEKEGETVSPETREKLKKVINEFMDFNELSRLALGKYWQERTEQEKKEFVEVFSQLIKNSSVKKLEIYKADRLVYKEPAITGQKARVTTIAYKERKNVEIVYKMHLAESQWLVYDIEIDGVSTAINYRDSFYKEIAKTSYREMYNKLANRLKEE
jgi:phospholipid transport system substrate-binding protein